MGLSLDHLQAFVTAVEAGSFSAAARRLGKAQSAVSTAVANLEIDLGVQLFERSGKYPCLTEEGEVLLRDARTILARCGDFQERAYAFSENVDARIRIAVDEILPQRAFVDVLTRFAAAFPETELEVLYGTLKDIQTLVAEGRADLGLLIPIDYPDKTVDARLIAYMPYCLVAAPGHPLSELAEVSPAELALYREFVVASRGGERLPDSIVFGSSIWMLESNELIRDLVIEGLGFAFLPRHLVEADLAAGRLLPLPVTLEQTAHQVPVYLLRAAAKPLGKAGLWLLDQLAGIDCG